MRIEVDFVLRSIALNVLLESRNAMEDLIEVLKANANAIWNEEPRMADTIDYRDLLKRYIRHVRECEGVDFIRDIRRNSDVGFSDDEVIELSNLTPYKDDVEAHQ